MNLKSLNKKKREGFTLIEMVMVVVIIGVLSSTAMMKYGDVQTNAKIKADCATASTIATATTMAISEGKVKDGSTNIMNILVNNNYLQSASQSNKTGLDFIVHVKNGNTITVTSGNDTFYPKYIENSTNQN